MGNLWSSGNQQCVFCKVLQSIENEDAPSDSKILKYNETFAVFSDIHPAAKHHYLVVPRKHMSNPKTLNGSEHADLVKDMHQFGIDFITEVDRGALEDIRYGFHMPPFISVDHLHMHIISPATQMGFVHSNLFRESSWYFLSPDALVTKVRKAQL